MTAKEEAVGVLDTPATAEDRTDSRAPSLALTEDVCNASNIAQLIAALELAGHVVRPISAGGYNVSRWNQVRYFPDADALHAFARKVGARV